jgi:hypothetical protein
MHSFPYLSERLEGIRTGLERPLDKEGWTPFFIPVIIKGLVGDALTYVGFPNLEIFATDPLPSQAWTNNHGTRLFG